MVKVISGCTKVRFESQVNHRQYCERWGYEYVWDEKPRDIKSPYDHKLRALLELSIDNQWWFWIDDDAFFTQIDTPLETFVDTIDHRTQLAFAKSPLNPQGDWTFLSSGNFFFKSSRKVHRFFQRALASDLSEIRKWWDEDELGLFTKGDQDKIVYQLFKQTRMMKQTVILPYDTFNFRPYHFEKSRDEHFLCHFAVPGVAKVDSIEAFRARFEFPDSSLTMPLRMSG